MTNKDFLPIKYAQFVERGKVTFKAPSNIALVKYWGKKGNQIPANPSISFTLDACATTTSISYSKLKERVRIFLLIYFLKENPRKILNPKLKPFLLELKNMCLF